MLVAVDAGRIALGSPAGEHGRSDDGREGPRRETVVVNRYALGRFEVTRGEFAAFVHATGYRTDAERNVGQTGCLAWDPDRRGFAWRPGSDWRKPGFDQDDRHPVTCVSWNDATAYVHWLTFMTGRTYRLPTESEWEHAARARTTTSRPWGNDPAAACRHANVADEAAVGLPDLHACNDGHPYTAPTGGRLANRFGIFDMIGNVWEWVADCYHSDAHSMPLDAWQSAITAPDCKDRAMRGGSWFSGPGRARSAYRGGYAAESRSNMYGFRVARSLP